MTYNIYQLINYSTGEVVQYDPHLASQVAEILDATARAAEAARLALLRERLTGLLPVTAPRPVNGDALAASFFALKESD